MGDPAESKTNLAIGDRVSWARMVKRGRRVIPALYGGEVVKIEGDSALILTPAGGRKWQPLKDLYCRAKDNSRGQ